MKRVDDIKELIADAASMDPARRRTFLLEQTSDAMASDLIETLIEEGSDDGNRHGLKTGGALAGVVGRSLLRRLGKTDESELVELGKVVGSFRIERHLGSGGMGAVYAAFDEKLERWVAVKSLQGKQKLSRNAKDRLRREAIVLARLDHPNICRIYDLLETEDGDYLVLELIEGQTLNHLMAADVDRERALEIAESVASALAAAHEERVVHRDLKPDNVMVTVAGTVKVLDFGISISLGLGGQESADGIFPDRPNITKVGTIIGTPRYMSPEQAAGTEVTESSDLYSFGLLLQELLTGRPAFAASLPLLELRRRALVGDREPTTGVDPELVTLIDELTAIEPAERPTARQALERIRWVVDRPRRRRRWLFKAIGSLAAVVVISALAVSVFEAVTARRDALELAVEARRFGEQVRSIETLVRLGHLSPLHDIAGERRRVELKGEEIRDRGGEIGGMAAVVAVYAEGRAELALNRPELAVELFHEAWSGDYQEPEVAFSLGLAYSALYDLALDAAESESTEGLRAAARAQAQNELRDPALLWMERGQSAFGESAFLTLARIAMYRNQMEEAERLTIRAADDAPWLYEAHQLRARILRLRGRSQRDDGHADMAAATYEAADKSLREAIEVGRSDPALRLDRCALTVERMSVAFDSGRPIRELYDLGAQACAAAVVADPANPRGQLQIADLEYTSAWWAKESGRDPQAWVERLWHATDRARELDPDNAEAYRLAGGGYTAVADFLTNTGGDPTNPLELAVAHLERAVELDPSSGKAAYSLGLARSTLGFYDLRNGLDPTAHLEAAIESFELAGKISPTNYAPQSMLGTCYGLLGSDDSGRGRGDPMARLEKSVEAFEKASRLAPEAPIPRGNLAMAYRDLARFSRLQGMPVEAYIASGRESVAIALELKPDEGQAHLTWVELEQIAARFAIDAGEDPSSFLAAADRHLERARADIAWAFLVSEYEVETLVLRVAGEVIAGRDPTQELDEARRALLEDADVENDASRLMLLAEVELWSARRARARNAPTEAAFRSGIRRIEQALAVTPNQGEAWLLRAELEEANGPMDVAAFENALAKAEEHNPFLAHRVAGLRSAAGRGDGAGE